MSASECELKNMIKMFTVCDLLYLLMCAQRNTSGKKDELQERALSLIELHSDYINEKIIQLYNKYQKSQDISQIKHQMLHSKPCFNVISQYSEKSFVTFKDLPFYDVLTELLKPASLAPLKVVGSVQEKKLSFYLRPQDVRQLNCSSDFQVQLRIGILVSNYEQEDDFPPSVCLKINHKTMLLNDISTKKPVDITSRVKRSSTAQLLCVSWPSSNIKPYVMGMFIVRKQTPYDLIKHLKENRVKNLNYTTTMIKKKLYHDRDSEIVTMSLRGSLICPLGKSKMILPCRAITCAHLQCFDAHLYIQMNEKNPKWICPVCNKSAVFNSLAIDGLFLRIIRNAPSDCTKVQFHENGSWTPIMPVKKVATAEQFQGNKSWSLVLPVKKVAEVLRTTFQSEIPKDEKQKKLNEIICLSDSDAEESWPLQLSKRRKVITQFL